MINVMIKLFILMLFPTHLNADEVARSAFDSSHILSQVGLALVLTLFAIFALAWLVKFFGYGSLKNQKNMALLGQMPVGNREKIILVEVNNKQLLIGVAPGKVSCLHVFDTKMGDKGEIARSIGIVKETDKEHDKINFSEYLQTLFSSK